MRAYGHGDEYLIDAEEIVYDLLSTHCTVVVRITMSTPCKFFFSYSIKCAAAVADFFIDAAFNLEGKRCPLGDVIV